MERGELTEQETAIYDRQIRVWGVDAQRRLSKAHVFVSGLKGTAIEFCKNIVLAGVGSLTLNDDRMVTEELLSANFLIPPDENVFGGKSVAELCCDSLKEFNPMVYVSVQKGWEIKTLNSLGCDLSSFDAEFFDKFDAVVISHCSLSTKKSVNAKCRKLSKRIAFYAVDVRDSCGEIFIDLQSYTYSKKKSEEMSDCQLNYPSFEEAIAVPWRGLPKRMAKLFFAMRDYKPSSPVLSVSYVIERFEEFEGGEPGLASNDADLLNVQKLRKELCEAQGLSESQISDSLLKRLLRGTREFPPVCAIIGGILGQEVIKAISGKGDPIKNFFFYDAMDGKGIIEDVSDIKTECLLAKRTAEIL
nr:SUMO-activating enzyme subunit 1B-1-like [Ipomoea batatas]